MFKGDQVEGTSIITHTLFLAMISLVSGRLKRCSTVIHNRFLPHVGRLEVGGDASIREFQWQLGSTSVHDSTAKSVRPREKDKAIIYVCFISEICLFFSRPEFDRKRGKNGKKFQTK